jgi:hypothetical protein
MSDIVERLRADPLRNFDEAADEIERLRAQVEAMKGYIHKAHERDGAEIERLRGAARFAHAAIKTYHTMYPHRATGALLDAAGRLWEVLDDE